MPYVRAFSTLIAIQVGFFVAAGQIRPQELKQRDGKQLQLDDTTYRLKVESILEPVGKVAIYRVQIWTKRQAKVYLDWGTQIGQEGLSRLDKMSNSYRAEFVLLAMLREAKKGQPRGRNVEVELRCLVGGAPGETVIRREGDSSTRLDAVLKVEVGEMVRPLGQKARIGEFEAKPLEIEIR